MEKAKLAPFKSYRIHIGSASKTSNGGSAAEHISRTLIWSRDFNRVDRINRKKFSADKVGNTPVIAEVSAFGNWNGMVSDMTLFSSYYRNLVFSVDVEETKKEVFRNGKHVSSEKI